MKNLVGLIQVSRPSSLTNKDATISFIVPDNEAYSKIASLEEDMRLGERWDFSDKRLPENYADTRIDYFYKVNEHIDGVTIRYRGNYYERISVQFYK